MAKLGFTLMMVIAATLGAASCDMQPRSLFADEPAVAASGEAGRGTEAGS